jgi:hypothetical protein
MSCPYCYCSQPAVCADRKLLCLGAGYLGAVGAFLSVHPMAGAAVSAAVASGRDPRKVSNPRIDLPVQARVAVSGLAW